MFAAEAEASSIVAGDGESGAPIVSGGGGTLAAAGGAAVAKVRLGASLSESTILSGLYG